MNNDKDISEIIKLEKKIKNSEIKVNKDNFIKVLNKKIIFLKNKYFKIEFKKYKEEVEKSENALLFLDKELDIIFKNLNSKKNNNNSFTRLINEIKIDICKFFVEELKNKKSKNDYYPSTNHEDFNSLICNKKEFYQNIYPKYKELETKKNGFEKTNIQKFVKNFISEHTIYNSLLLWHGVGAGKTCAAIGIAENFRDFIILNGKKILIIGLETLKNNWKNEIFNIDKVDYNNEVHNQCTSENAPYIKNLNPNIRGKFNIMNNYKKDDIVHYKGNTYKYINDIDNKHVNPEKLNNVTWKKTFDLKKINNLIENYYEFLGYIKLTNLIKREFFYKKNNNFGYDLAKFIKKKFSNRVIIIDEVHNLRKNEEPVNINEEVKLGTNFIELIARYAENTKLILLSATPMYNESIEIVNILNLLLLNDKKAPLIKDLIFDSQNKIKNKDLFIKKTKGYISYIKGYNPNYFPKIIYPLNYFIKFKNKIVGKPFKSDIVLFESKSNSKIDNFMKNIKNQISYITDRQAANILLPDKNNKLNLVSKKKKILKNQFEKVNMDNLIEYSPKFYNVIQSILNCKGKVFVYSEFIWSGVKSFCMALEKFGIKNYLENFLDTEKNSEFCANNLKFKKDLSKNEVFKQCKYLYIDGDINKDELNKYISIFNDKNNNNGSEIKIVVASRVIEVGISFFSIREVHILDPWFNFSKIKQIIGRSTRNFSHHQLEILNRNVTIFLHSLDGKYSKDKKIYEIAIRKQKKISEIERELKKNSIDCCLNKYVNMFIGEFYPELNEKTIINSKNKKMKLDFTDKDNSLECDFMKCRYECNGEFTKTDNSTFNDFFSRDYVNKLKISIKNLFKNNYVLSEKNIIKKINLKNKENLKYVFIALDELVKFNEITYDYFGKKGTIINRNEYYIFQPNIFEDKSAPLLYRYLPNEKLIEKFDLDWDYQVVNKKNNQINIDEISKGTVKKYKNLIGEILKFKNFSKLTNNFRKILYDGKDNRPKLSEIKKYFIHIFLQKIPTLINARESLLVNAIENLINKSNDEIDDLIIEYYDTKNIFTFILRKIDLYPEKYTDILKMINNKINNNYKINENISESRLKKYISQIKDCNKICAVRFYKSNNLYCREIIPEMNPGTNIWIYNENSKKMVLDKEFKYQNFKFNLSIFNDHISDLVNTQVKGPPPNFKNIKLNSIFGYYCNSSKGFNLKPNSNSLRIVNNLHNVNKKITSKFDKSGNRIMSKKTILKGAECGSGTKANTVKDLLKLLVEISGLKDINKFRNINISLGKENTNKLKSWIGSHLKMDKTVNFSEALEGCLCTDIEIFLNYLDFQEMKKSHQTIKISDIFYLKKISQNKDIPKTIIIPFQKFNNEFSKNGKFKRYVLKIEETYMCSDVRESKPIKRKRGRQKKQIKK